MSKQSIATAALIVTFLFSLVLFSGCKDNEDDDHHAFILDYIEDVLDLTPEL